MIADARWLEPGWIKIKRVRLGKGKPAHRFVHFTDLHHKGDRQQLQSVVRMTNALSPDFVCFTGDLIEESAFLDETLEVLSGIQSPMYGVPGNHDFWSGVAFDGIAKCFAATGGAWLMDEQQLTADGRVTIIGASCRNSLHPLPPGNPGTHNILLLHYPAWAKSLHGRKFDLLLAGHSHGGQVRIPFFGAVMLPFLVDEYDVGLFETPAGPLYVNPGIGWFAVPVRFCCRPEITLIEM